MMIHGYLDLGPGLQGLWAPCSFQYYRAPITPAGRNQQTVELIRLERFDISDAMNALGSYGIALRQLERDGLVERAGYNIQTQSTAYRLSEEGKAERKRIRRADLAAIGVYEIHDA